MGWPTLLFPSTVNVLTSSCFLIQLPTLFLLVITCLVYQCADCVCALVVISAMCIFLSCCQGDIEIPAFSYLKAQHVSVQGIYWCGKYQKVNMSTKVDVFIYMQTTIMFTYRAHPLVRKRVTVTNVILPGLIKYAISCFIGT